MKKFPKIKKTLYGVNGKVDFVCLIFDFKNLLTTSTLGATKYTSSVQVCGKG